MSACAEMGVATCLEVVDSGEATGRLEATNVFELQTDGWRIVHHHATPTPRV